MYDVYWHILQYILTKNCLLPSLLRFPTDQPVYKCSQINHNVCQTDQPVYKCSQINHNVCQTDQPVYKCNQINHNVCQTDQPVYNCNQINHNVCQSVGGDMCAIYHMNSLIIYVFKSYSYSSVHV